MSAHIPPPTEEIPPTPGPVSLMGVSEIFAPLPAIPYLMEALDICPGAPALMAGLGFSAKTLLAHALGLAVACDAPAWGAYPVRSGRVLLLDYEQGSYLTRRRIQRMARGMGIVPDGDALKIACMPRMYLDEKGEGKDAIDPEEELTKLCRGVTLAVIDSLSASCPNLEENAASARKVLDMLGRVSEATGCTIIVIHHSRKPSQGAEGGSRAAIRGSGALFDACGAVVTTERQSDGTIRISHEKARMSGKLVEPIYVSIVDTDDGGLAINTKEGPKGGTKAGAKLDATKEAIVAYLTEHGTAASKNALKERIGGDRNKHYAAVAELVAEGVIVIGDDDNKHAVRLAPEGAASDE